MITKNQVGSLLIVVAGAMAMTACGGGGGGSTPSGGGTVQTPTPVVGGGSIPVVYYPYETVYGDVCLNSEPTPGCTFVRSTGARVTVSSDPHYDRYGYNSDDLWFVHFDYSGNASVYNDIGVYQYSADPSDFAGWVGGNTIGVGTTGLFWENVAGGQYFFGKNGVLYSGNSFNSNFGQAINNKEADQASDTNLAALVSDANKKLVSKAATGLMTKYGFKQEKATAVASALNSWAVAAADRGKTTSGDIDKTIKGVFGVKFSDALAAVKDFQAGDSSSAKDLTDRSAAALGLKPNQAKDFVKGMYKKALANYGYDVNQINF